MRAGHSFVLHIQTEWPITAAASDHQHHGEVNQQVASHSQSSCQADDAMDYVNEQPGSPGGQPPHEHPDADPHDSASEASIHSADRSILVYRLHARDEHCFVTWSTYMTILDGIIHALRLLRSQIRTFHRLAVVPPDIMRSLRKPLFSNQYMMYQQVRMRNSSLWTRLSTFIPWHQVYLFLQQPADR